MGMRFSVIADVDIAPLSPQELIQAYLPLVKNVANQIMSRCPANVDVDDLINVGVMGLMDAAERFSPEFGKPFRYYAELRIRGEILDELRQNDWVPRSTRKKIDLIERTRQSLEKQNGPKVSDTQVAEQLGIGLEKLHRVTGRALVGTFLSLEELGVQDEEQLDLLDVLEGGDPDPDMLLRLREVEESLAQAIRELPHREKVLISLYYYQELSLKEIGRVLGVTESRVSQMHTRALTRLKKSVLRGQLETS